MFMTENSIKLESYTVESVVTVQIMRLYQTTDTYNNSHVAFFAINDLYARNVEMKTACKFHFGDNACAPFRLVTIYKSQMYWMV